MFRLIYPLILAAWLLVPSMAMALDGFVQPIGEGGSLDWGTGEIVVKRPLAAAGEVASANDRLAIRRAVIGARKQLLDMILSTRIDAHQTVSSALADDAALAGNVRGLVQSSPLLLPDLSPQPETGQTEETTAEESGEPLMETEEVPEAPVVRVHEMFRGKLAELVLPTTLPFQSGIPPKLSASMDHAFNLEEPLETVGSVTSAYSGVIIDARGLSVTPALAPVVYGRDGEGVYGAFMVSRASTVTRGMVAYTVNPDPAGLAGRVGSRPLVVKALSVYGSWRTDLVVSTPMGKLIHKTMSTTDAAANCRMVIVVDPAVASRAAQADPADPASSDLIESTLSDEPVAEEPVAEEADGALPAPSGKEE